MSEKSKQLHEGRRRLREWLPAAREAVANGPDLRAEATSAIGKAVTAYVREDNLDAVIIYPAPMGGWHADVKLKKVPPGVADVMGTPVGQPCKTRADAEATGRHLLEYCLVIEKQNRERAPASAPPAFELFDWTLPLIPQVYEKASAIMPEFAKGYGSTEHALRRIEETLAALADEGHAVDEFNDWPDGPKSRLLGILHIAALSGVLRYPPLQDASPSGHTETSTKRH